MNFSFNEYLKKNISSFQYKLNLYNFFMVKVDFFLRAKFTAAIIFKKSSVKKSNKFHWVLMWLQLKPMVYSITLNAAG